MAMFPIHLFEWEGMIDRDEMGRLLNATGEEGRAGRGGEEDFEVSRLLRTEVIEDDQQAMLRKPGFQRLNLFFFSLGGLDSTGTQIIKQHLIGGPAAQRNPQRIFELARQPAADLEGGFGLADAVRTVQQGQGLPLPAQQSCLDGSLHPAGDVACGC